MKNLPKYILVLAILAFDILFLFAEGTWLKDAGLPTWAIVLLLGK